VLSLDALLYGLAGLVLLLLSGLVSAVAKRQCSLILLSRFT
jgi:hypothetical protein